MNPIPHPVTPTPRRAWLYLIHLGIRRQARVGQMAWIAAGLLVFATMLVGITTLGDWWAVNKVPFPRGRQGRGFTHAEWADVTDALLLRSALPGSPLVAGVNQALIASYRVGLDESSFYRFSNAVVFIIFVSFLLPLWCLSFATEALGGEREGSSLVWLLTRPLSRPAIYLAKFMALLPWCFGLSVGGFAIICLAGGRPGWKALQLYWPAVVCGTLAFSALYHLMGAFFKRPAIVALVYSFFLETLMGNMPGYLKRASISFYTRCMMFDAGQAFGVEPEKPSVYLAVVLLILGMFLFSRTEYLTAD
jgi:ABC-2 type transport system permease protein